MTGSKNGPKRRRRRRVKLAHEVVPMSSRARSLVRLLFGTGIAAVAIVAFPFPLSEDTPVYLEGTIASEEVIAPFYFEVLRSPADMEHLRALEAEKVPPVFTRRPADRGVRSMLVRLHRSIASADDPGSLADSLGLGPRGDAIRGLSSGSGGALIEAAAGLLEEVYEIGLVGDADAALLRQRRPVRVSGPTGEAIVSTDDIFDRERLGREAARRGKALGPNGESALASLALAVAVPNLSYNAAATEADRAAARAAVSDVIASVQEGERIVHKHDRITADHAMKLEALRRAGNERRSGMGSGTWILRILARSLLVVLVLSLTAFYIRIFRPAVWERTGLLALVATLMAVTLALGGLVTRLDLPILLLPVPFAAVLVASLMGDVIALGVVVALSTLLGALTGWDLSRAVPTAVGGVIAAFAVRNILHRMEFLRAIVPIALGMVTAVVAIRFMEGTGSTWLQDVGVASGNAVVSVALAMFILPLFEKAFGLASNITLLELSDLNRPIFKRMMLEANGTYHHSMIVGSLGETAAEAVRANPLLARVGGYYHDIGKIAKSTYFGENLREGVKNPHEKLTPHMSSLILESHVRDGLELAREIGLPETVAAFIPEHQGTTLMQYFFTKAQELDPEVEERDYRYPGPRPQGKETAIIMLADAAEAIVRSMDDHSPKSIRAALARLFETRIADGQLDECGLTLADLAKIRDAFTHVLTGVYHGRVKYQWQLEGDRRGAAGPERVFHPELETGIGSKDPRRELAGSSQAPGRAHRR